MANFTSKMIDHDTRICVLAGGSETEKRWAVKSGLNVVKILRSLGFINVKLVKTDSCSIKNILDYDVVFISAFGKPWQEGLAQLLCERCGVPYTGSDSRSSSLAFNKNAAKRIFKKFNIPTPAWVYSCGKIVAWNTVSSKIGKNAIIKPVEEGLSKNVVRVGDKKEYYENLKRIVKENRRIIVEEYINGTEISVPVIRAKDSMVLPPIRIIKSRDVVNYLALAKSRKTMYKRFFAKKSIVENVKKIARKCFYKLNCRGIGYVDIIVEASTGVPYVLEVGTVPGFTNKSKVPFSASLSNISLEELITINLLIALKKDIRLKRIFRNAKILIHGSVTTALEFVRTT